MFEKFLASLSFIKKKPSLLQKYIVPEIRPFTYLYIFLRRIYGLKDFLKRKSMIKNFNLEGLNKIPKEKGYLVSKSSTARKKILKITNHVSNLSDELSWTQVKNKSKKSFLMSHPIDLIKKENVDIIDFLMEEEIIGRISSYLGQVPVLLSANIWYSPNEVYEEGRSQQFHLDNGDVRQLRLLIPIRDVTRETGPMTVISKEESDNIYKNLKKHNCKKRFGYPIQSQKFDDKFILQFNPKLIELTGNIGDIIFVDTCNCYHFGSRPSKKASPRVMLSFLFETSQGLDIPLWGINNVDVLNELNINKFSNNYKNIVLNNLLKHYVSNKKKKFFTDGY